MAGGVFCFPTPLSVRFDVSWFSDELAVTQRHSHPWAMAMLSMPTLPRGALKTNGIEDVGHALGFLIEPVPRPLGCGSVFKFSRWPSSVRHLHEASYKSLGAVYTHGVSLFFYV